MILKVNFSSDIAVSDTKGSISWVFIITSYLRFAIGLRADFTYPGQYLWQNENHTVGSWLMRMLCIEKLSNRAIFNFSIKSSVKRNNSTKKNHTESFPEWVLPWADSHPTDKDCVCMVIGTGVDHQGQFVDHDSFDTDDTDQFPRILRLSGEHQHKFEKNKANSFIHSHQEEDH